MAQNLFTSPRWSSTTKLLAGLILIGIIAFLLHRFSSLIPPLLLILIVIYLLHPVTAAISNALQISWKVSVNILYLNYPCRPDRIADVRRRGACSTGPKFDCVCTGYHCQPSGLCSPAFITGLSIRSFPAGYEHT